MMCDAYYEWVKLLSHVWLFSTPWTVAHQAPPSMEFSRQGYWSALPFPSPGDLLDLGIKPRYPALQADALPSEPPGKPRCLLWGRLYIYVGIEGYWEISVPTSQFYYKHKTTQKSQSLEKEREVHIKRKYSMDKMPKSKQSEHQENNKKTIPYHTQEALKN